MLPHQIDCQQQQALPCRTGCQQVRMPVLVHMPVPVPVPVLVPKLSAGQARQRGCPLIWPRTLTERRSYPSLMNCPPRTGPRALSSWCRGAAR